MRVLGIDTATWTASAGVIDEDRILAERSLAVRGSHAAILVGLIEGVLADAGVALPEAELIAVSIGPGSFTGLRVGLSVAKGLAFATGAPIVGVPTLEACALAAGRREGLVCALLDARRKEVYGAVYRWTDGGLVALRPPDVLAPQRFADLLEPPCTLVGEGVDAYADLWRARFGDAAVLLGAAALAPLGPAVAHLGRERFRARGADDLALLEPLYVRRSEAEVRRDEIARAATAPERVEKLTG